MDQELGATMAISSRFTFSMDEDLPVEPPRPEATRQEEIEELPLLAHVLDGPDELGARQPSEHPGHASIHGVIR